MAFLRYYTFKENLVDGRSVNIERFLRVASLPINHVNKLILFVKSNNSVCAMFRRRQCNPSHTFHGLCPFHYRRYHDVGTTSILPMIAADAHSSQFYFRLGNHLKATHNSQQLRRLHLVP